MKNLGNYRLLHLLTLFCLIVIHAPAQGQSFGTSALFSWQPQNSGTTASLRGIHAVTDQIAWASGTNGTVLRTTDGGQHWQPCAIPAALDFRGVEGWDAETAIVMASGDGNKSALYKTTDGCKSWTLLFQNPDAPQGFFDSFWIDRKNGHGMLLGDPVAGRFVIFHTQDGGKSWQRDTDAGLSTHSKSLGAFAASNGSILHDGEHVQPLLVGGGKDGAVQYAFYDGYWTQAKLPLASGTDGAGAFAVAHRGDAILTVGGDYTKPNATTGVATINGMAGSQQPHGYRSTIAWSDALKAWITAGINGSDISRDNGQTWQPIDHENWNAISLPYIVGPNGRIARLKANTHPAGVK